MSRSTFEPMRVFWLSVLADKAAPTVAEINAGTELTSQIPVDGVDTSPTQNNASQPMLGDAFVSEEPGTWGTSVTLTFVRDDNDVTEIAEGLFDYRTKGFLVVLPYGGTVQAGTFCDVYPATTHKPVPLPSAENEYQKVQVQLAVTAAPEYRVSIVGGS